jgi:hypothetical protein
MEDTMPERRKSKRRSISYYMRIVDVGTNQMIGHLADINLQGLKIDSQKPLQVNKDYRLRIYTTADVADKDHIDFVTRAKWCEPEQLEPGIYNIGFEILEIDRHDAGIIQHIMDKYCIRENNLDFLNRG